MKLLFVSIMVMISVLHPNAYAANSPPDCTRVKKGMFYYEASPDFFIIIERNGNFQRQHRLYETFYKVESITWLDPCAYILKTTEVNDPFLGNEIGSESEIRIVSVNENYYEYITKENGKWKDTQRIYFLKDLAKIIEKQKKYNVSD
ncbi:hypothetical protein [Leptospira jelokensis]|uniref:Uncharacterized protein n=1 Tax=Leptospira jelokensis TaxID=2484931 RepID=A0A4Z0ZSU2_9LEPT|nr:hypothetical protein [Leptospira jelokensis]TGL66479.1 hypothetical protein EHQ62_09885 [Leptospira jelokensis]